MLSAYCHPPGPASPSSAEDGPALAIFEGLDAHSAREARALMTPVHVPAGERIIQDGEYDPSLAIVASGTLRCTLNGVVLREVVRGEIVGDGALFGNGYRSASVDTVTECTLFLLNKAGYAKMRREGHRLASLLESQILESLVTQLAEAHRQVSRRPGPLYRPPRNQLFYRMTGWFLRQALRPVGETLGAARPFRGTSERILQALAQRVEVLSLRAGDPLIGLGNPEESVYFVACGSLVAMRPTGFGQRVVGTVTPGHFVGGTAAISRPARAAVSLFARESAVLYGISRLQWSLLSGGVMGTALRVALIRSLADQLASLDGYIAAVPAPRHAPDVRP